MNRILAKLAIILVAAAVPVTASAQAAIEGRWKNAKGSVVVRVAPCGGALCGYVVDATAKAKAGARKGGTDDLIGTRILTNLRPVGNGTYRGQAFEPKRNIHVPATVRVISPTVLSVKGCLIAGIICKEQRWTRVS